jgi:hypothetical protein
MEGHAPPGDAALAQLLLALGAWESLTRVRGGCWAIRGDSHPATPRPCPENVHLPRETATYPPAGARWIEAIVLSPARAVKEGGWGPSGGSNPVGATKLVLLMFYEEYKALLGGAGATDQGPRSRR